jgi:hypothetical protein
MSRHDYPRIGRVDAKPAWQKIKEGTGPKCDVRGCGCTARVKVQVEVSVFRGDDEVRKACETHKNAAAELLHEGGHDAS